MAVANKYSKEKRIKARRQSNSGGGEVDSGCYLDVEVRKKRPEEMIFWQRPEQKWGSRGKVTLQGEKKISTKAQNKLVVFEECQEELRKR